MSPHRTTHTDVCRPRFRHLLRLDCVIVSLLCRRRLLRNPPASSLVGERHDAAQPFAGQPFASTTCRVSNTTRRIVLGHTTEKHASRALEKPTSSPNRSQIDEMDAIECHAFQPEGGLKCKSPVKRARSSTRRDSCASRSFANRYSPSHLLTHTHTHSTRGEC